MPITLWQLLRHNAEWPFGPNTQWLCGFVVSAQSVPLFMSSMAIVTIAWDRYRCVLHNVRYMSQGSQKYLTAKVLMGFVFSF